MKKQIAIAALALVAASLAQARMDPSVAIKADKDKNGKVTKEEYIGVFAPTFDRKDKDKDGLLSKAEYTHAAFKHGDMDQNGMLTRAEYQSIFEKQFDNMREKYKDGIVTTEEMPDSDYADIPEPSSFVLLAGCFSLAYLMVRRRQVKA